MELNLFGNLYTGRRVLVTGHTGFKGSWLVLWLQALGAKVAGLALDPNTEPAHWDALCFDGMTDYRTDLRDAQSVHEIMQAYQPEIVFHLAAQPLVRRGYRDPVGTFNINIMGLVNLLEAIRMTPSTRVLVNATTDKIYAERTMAYGYRESDPLGAHDPYSSSKACAELISECYRKSYFSSTGAATRIATARAGNVIGGGDWAEDRLVPDLVRAVVSGDAITLRNPASIRPWQHVLEPLCGYLRLAQMLWTRTDLASAWNFGPGVEAEITVQSFVTRFASHWSTLRIERDCTAQPHEAAVLRLDVSKASRELGWRPVWPLNVAIEKTARWYRDFYESGDIGSRKDLADYVDDARRLGLAWTI